MNEARNDMRFDELLAHGGWVRRLASGLVRDPNAADDLVQEAWLAALRSPPDDPDHERAWFFRVVHNARVHAARRDRRRAERESAMARDEVGPVGDVAERVELQRTLVDAVERLSEPFRTTVVLRYFEELTASEIARRTGELPATVRSRLKRGLARLREDLDRSWGERSAWVAALTALSGAPARAGRVSLGLRFLVGGGLLVKKLLIVLVGLVCLLLFLLLRSPDVARDDRPLRLDRRPRTVPDERAPAPTEARVTPRPDLPRAAPPVVPPKVSVPEPVVAVVPVEPASPQLPPERLLVTENGSLELVVTRELAPGPGPVTVHVEPARGLDALLHRRSQPVDLGRPGIWRGVPAVTTRVLIPGLPPREVVVEPDDTVRLEIELATVPRTVVVKAAVGGYLPDARVVWLPGPGLPSVELGRTDPSGRARDVLWGRTGQIVAQHRGHGSSAPVDIPEHGDVVCDLDGHGFAVTGVVTANAKPVPGAHVYLFDPRVRSLLISSKSRRRADRLAQEGDAKPQTLGAAARVSCDAEGRFAMEGVEVGAYELHVRSPGQVLSRPERIRVSGDLEVPELRLDAACRLVGRVAVTGDPTVRPWLATRAGVHSAVRVARDGSYLLDGVPRGDGVELFEDAAGRILIGQESLDGRRGTLTRRDLIVRDRRKSR